MRSSELAVAVVDRIRLTGVCLFCDRFDRVDLPKEHGLLCPVGEYERTNLRCARRYLATEAAKGGK